MERPEQTHHLMPKSHEYSALHPNDPLDDDDDAAAAGSEPTPTRRQSFWRNRAWWQWIVLLQLANILVFLVLENRKGIAHRIAKARDPIASSYHDLFTKREGVEYLGIKEGYWTRLQNQTFWKWMLLPKNGIVMLHNKHLPALDQTLAKRPTTPPLLPPGTENHSLYQVAVFHSLHCLEMIHKRLLDPSGFTPRDCSGLEWGFDAEDGYNQTLQTACHIQHCVDWIRQDIMCLADPTLEPFVIADEVRFEPEYHQCRSFENVRSWAQRNEYPGSMASLQAFG